jgi:hypothetical protein
MATANITINNTNTASMHLSSFGNEVIVGSGLSSCRKDCGNGHQDVIKIQASDRNALASRKPDVS